MDRLILHNAQRGDADAFSELVGPYEGLVYRHCLQLLQNPADAQDAAQETLLRAYRAMPRFLGLSHVATWLYRIAHNVCLDWLKRPGNRRQTLSLETLRDEGVDPADPQPSPEEQYLQTSERQHLCEAIARLPAAQQTLLSLRFGDGLSYQELAETLHLSEGTVKSRLNRAREKLRGQITDI